MTKTDIKIVQVNINELNPAPYNPRHWSEEATRGLTESIKRFGLVDPIIVNSAKNRKNVVIGGHFRLKVAKDLGYQQIPVVYIHIPDLEKEKELNLRLNRNTGEWDFELLKEFEVEMLLDVGFNDSDLSHIWDEQLATEPDGFNVEKALEAIEEPKTKLGDIYQLGRHQLHCGDATDAQTVTKLMNGNHADMLYYDPPYNIGLDYNKGVSTQGKYGGVVNDDKSITDYKQFLVKALENGLAVSKSDVHVFTWCDENYIGLLQTIYKELGINHKRVCLWVKNNQNMTPQIAFNKVYEPCVYGVRGKPFLSSTTNLNEILNKEIGTGNQVADDILDLFSIWLAKRKAGQEYLHPTEKPVTLHEKPLRRCTKPGDVVLDLFGGSGSTLVACEQLNRTAYLMELSPVFCDVIVERYFQLTGKKAELCK
jgi:DNA modification methylase